MVGVDDASGAVQVELTGRAQAAVAVVVKPGAVLAGALDAKRVENSA